MAVKNVSPDQLFASIVAKQSKCRIIHGKNDPFRITDGDRSGEFSDPVRVIDVVHGCILLMLSGDFPRKRNIRRAPLTALLKGALRGMRLTLDSRG